MATNEDGKEFVPYMGLTKSAVTNPDETRTLCLEASFKTDETFSQFVTRFLPHGWSISGNQLLRTDDAPGVVFLSFQTQQNNVWGTAIKLKPISNGFQLVSGAFPTSKGNTQAWRLNFAAQSGFLTHHYTYDAQDFAPTNKDSGGVYGGTFRGQTNRLRVVVKGAPTVFSATTPASNGDYTYRDPNPIDSPFHKFLPNWKHQTVLWQPFTDDGQLLDLEDRMALAIRYDSKTTKLLIKTIQPICDVQDQDGNNDWMHSKWNNNNYIYSKQQWLDFDKKYLVEGYFPEIPPEGSAIYTTHYHAKGSDDISNPDDHPEHSDPRTVRILKSLDGSEVSDSFYFQGDVDGTGNNISSEDIVIETAFFGPFWFRDNVDVAILNKYASHYNIKGRWVVQRVYSFEFEQRIWYRRYMVYFIPSVNLAFASAFSRAVPSFPTNPDMSDANAYPFDESKQTVFLIGVNKTMSTCGNFPNFASLGGDYNLEEILPPEQYASLSSILPLINVKARSHLSGDSMFMSDLHRMGSNTLDQTEGSDGTFGTQIPLSSIRDKTLVIPFINFTASGESNFPFKLENKYEYSVNRIFHTDYYAKNAYWQDSILVYRPEDLTVKLSDLGLKNTAIINGNIVQLLPNLQGETKQHVLCKADQGEVKSGDIKTTWYQWEIKYTLPAFYDILEKNTKQIYRFQNPYHQVSYAADGGAKGNFIFYAPSFTNKYMCNIPGIPSINNFRVRTYSTGQYKGNNDYWYILDADLPSWYVFDRNSLLKVSMRDDVRTAGEAFIDELGSDISEIRPIIQNTTSFLFTTHRNKNYDWKKAYDADINWWLLEQFYPFINIHAGEHFWAWDHDPVAFACHCYWRNASSIKLFSTGNPINDVIAFNESGSIPGTAAILLLDNE